MPDLIKEKTTTPKFWKSLKEYYNDPEVLSAKVNEFKDGVTDDFDPSEMNTISRRKFVALLSASAAFAATACTDYRDKGEIIPYSNRPEGLLPGKPNYYASTISDGAESYGVLIKTREGRPIKIEGNPEHPINKGKIGIKLHSGILNLYDPERLEAPMKGVRKATWAAVDREIVSALSSAAEDGKEIAVVCNKVTSPVMKQILDDLKSKFGNVSVYSYEFHNDSNRRKAWAKSYGIETPLPSLKWDSAKVILSIGGDFLGREGNTVENSRLFTAGRDVMKSSEFNKLYCAEAGLSMTGANADKRFRLAPDEYFDFVLSIINEIAVTRNVASYSFNSTVLRLLQQFSLSKFISRNNLDEGAVYGLVSDLLSYRGKSIVYAGNNTDESVHLAVNLLNEILNNRDQYDFENASYEVLPNSNNFELKKLTERMSAGDVGVLLNLDSNPVYHLSSLSFAEAAKNVGTIVTLSMEKNESSKLSHYTLPVNHALESWGASRTRMNVYSMQQPVIYPLFDSRQAEAILLNWINGGESFTEDQYLKYFKEHFKNEVYAKVNPASDFTSFWNAALHDGFVNLNPGIAALPKMNLTEISKLKTRKKSEGFQIVVEQSYYVGDGRYANNGWLQEMPHPVAKVSWDNFAAVSPASAETLGVENNDVIRVGKGELSVELPVIVQPGVADNVIITESGYGRTECGEVGVDVGFDVNGLVDFGGKDSPWVTSGVNVEKTGSQYKLVSTQEHHSLDDTFLKDIHLKRGIVQEGTVEEYKEHPHFLHEEKHELFSITDDHVYDGLKWGMAIDLNKCTGCNICTASCNVENNVPVVGKDQVGNGREMAWIRIDRYYSGTPEDPQVSNQPMLCQHCDNAPCENVCPVNATNHSPDGLNQMVYNRCVGTRYCSNNCPYKVRRFNFHNFRDHFADAYYDNDLTALVNNPEVTVRSRGVMEKCTFCVQRIMEARENAIREGKELNGSDVVTACQQSCPTNAIVFGDTSDPESEISKYREHELGYHVLEELNIKPNVTYLAKLRNTHSEEV